MSTFDNRGTIDASVRQSLRMSFPGGRIFPQLFRRPLFGSGTVMFRRDCVSTVGYFDEELLVGSDYEMWMRIARHFEVGFIDAPLLMYRFHPTMSTLGTGRKMYNGIPWEAAVLQKILQRYPAVIDELGRSTVNRRLSKPYADLALARFRLSNYENARPLFRRAVAYWPTSIRYWAFYAATFLHPTQIAAARTLYRHVSMPRRERHIRPAPASARRSANQW
jgi:hypothetical protein